MVANQAGDVVGRDHPGVPSLVDVLCTLAANWVNCVCGKKMKESGVLGWRKKGEELEERINELNIQLPVVDLPSKKAKMQAELKQLEKQSKILNDEWGLAWGETDEYLELFWDAREFCTKACGIGDDELFNASLVAFDPSRLPPDKGPSNERVSQIVSLLRQVSANEWASESWANPVKPTMRAVAQVSPEQRKSFIDRNLKQVEIVSAPPQPEATFPTRWSSYREPSEWLRLRKFKGLSHSVNIWSLLCRNNPDDIQRESSKSARISFELAQKWGLDLPEFRANTLS